MDWKLELVALPVTDVDRAKEFYVEKLGFNADIDATVSDEMRFVQLTPPESACSIAVGLDVANGEIYGFLGPNGAGKSTTVRMLCTLLAPTSGCASVAGFDVVEQPGAVRLRIGVALQEAALDPRQTGTELLLLQGRLYGLSRLDARRRVEE